MSKKTASVVAQLPKNNEKYVNEFLSLGWTYYHARYFGGSPIFAYGHTSAVDEDFHMMKNRNQIDCSSYISLLLRGISFEASPYARLVPGLDPEGADLFGKALVKDIKKKIKPNDKYIWSFDPSKTKLRKRVAEPALYPVRTASQLGEMFVNMGRCFDFSEDFSDVEPGDIIFQAKKTPNGYYKQPNRYKKYRI